MERNTKASDYLPPADRHQMLPEENDDEWYEESKRRRKGFLRFFLFCKGRPEGLLKGVHLHPASKLAGCRWSTFDTAVQNARMLYRKEVFRRFFSNLCAFVSLCSIKIWNLKRTPCYPVWFCINLSDFSPARRLNKLQNALRTQFVIVNSYSSIIHQTSYILHQTSYIFHQTSYIIHHTSTIRHQVTSARENKIKRVLFAFLLAYSYLCTQKCPFFGVFTSLVFVITFGSSIYVT